MNNKLTIDEDIYTLSGSTQNNIGGHRLIGQGTDAFLQIRRILISTDSKGVI